jgi:hypothetical protein
LIEVDTFIMVELNPLLKEQEKVDLNFNYV